MFEERNRLVTTKKNVIDRRHALIMGSGMAATLLASGALPRLEQAHATGESSAQQQAAGQTNLDRKGIEHALGKKGQLMSGGVFRVSMPRTDLHVRVNGVPI